MVKKMLQKKKKRQNDKFPRARDWTLTTDRNMVRSDALPTELRGTCQYDELNFKVMFYVSCAPQKSSLETYVLFDGTKRISFVMVCN